MGPLIGEVPVELPPAVFIGFRVKHVPKVGDVRDDLIRIYGGQAKKVIEICSISECIAPGPPGWEARWDFNRAMCYDTEAIALAIIPEGQSDRYELFAHHMLPLEFIKAGQIRNLDLRVDLVSGLPPLPESEPDLSTYAMIGYDIAGGPVGENGMGFNCSPLSCSGCAEEHPVNRFCLIDDLSAAVEVARDFAETEPEPGPYYLYEILRKRSNRWSP